MTNAFATRLSEANVRTEKMFWLPGIATMVPSEFREFIEDDAMGERALMKQLPWFFEMLADEDFGLDADECVAEFYRKGCNGFLVQLAHPIPQEFHKNGNGYSFSWGHYRTEWFYFETLDEVCDHAEKWSGEIVEEAREKAAATAI